MRKVVLAVVLAACVTASLVAAAVIYTLTVNAQVTIVPSGETGASGELKAYTTSTCGVELTVLDLGEIPAGGSKTVRFYVKNLGNVDVSLSVRSDLNSAVGSVTYECLPQAISPGDISQINVHFDANAEASTGTYSFKIYVDAAA